MMNYKTPNRQSQITKQMRQQLSFEESNRVSMGMEFKSLKAGESEVYHLGYLWMKIKWKI